MPQLGEVLIQKGLITPEQLEVALREIERTGEVLGKVLVRLRFLTQEQLLKALAEQLGLEFYSELRSVEIPPEVIKRVPARLVWHYKFIPLKIKGKILTIAVSDPLAIWTIEDLRLRLGMEIERVLAPEEEILIAIRKYYGVGSETVEQILSQEPGEVRSVYEERRGRVEDLEKGAGEASVIKLVNQIIQEAISSRATDIHLEPYRNKVRLRYRIDGILYDMRLPEEIKYLYDSIVSRIKIMANLDLVERRLPQDGRAIIKIQGRQVDLRVSTIPSLYGESVVIRILPVRLLYRLEDLGFSSQELKIMEELMKSSTGIIFLTGPTGSGKTTTLYACLNKLNKEAVKIITIEDPIEYEIVGITQFQVKPQIGFTFANALRSILRHDPDIMMVGEVRDLETAELAIRTSLTGHLIFSTLHTNDAVSGVTRLLDIGIEPYLVASSVKAFISQRLVRVICAECREEVKDKDLFPSVFKEMRVYKGRGCDSCKSIGYRGRTAIYEIFLLNDKIRELILKKSSARELKIFARKEGFKTLWDAGVEKVREGITTPQEVLRVVESEE